MACFLVPTTEAIVTTVIKHAADKKGSDNIFIKKMGWLNNMLWGGSALLAFEHVWHGEVTPWFPFLTAAANPVDAAEMLRCHGSSCNTCLGRNGACVPSHFQEESSGCGQESGKGIRRKYHDIAYHCICSSYCYYPLV